MRIGGWEILKKVFDPLWFLAKHMFRQTGKEVTL